MHAPPRIKDIERYWNDPPPAVTPRCMFWVRRITEQGWRTNRRVGSMDYYSKAEFFGVYIWEYLVILARPFRSRRKYLQAVGRGMRWRRGPRPIVIDHGNNAPRFDLWPGDDIEWSLTPDLPSNGPLWKQCEKCLERIPLGATVCPECSHACPIERAQKERDEVNAKLEEATRAEYRALRVRVEAMAKKKGAPPEWVDVVMESSPSR